MSEVSFTRQDDWDKDMNNLIFDWYCDRVTSGELTRAEAMQLYVADVALQVNDLPPAA